MKIFINKLLREGLLGEIDKSIYDIIKNDYSDGRIVMTHEEEINFRPTTRYKQDIGDKPKGLWYGIGTSWIDFVKDEKPEWFDANNRGYKNVFVLDIDISKMMIIKNYNQLVEFEEKYIIRHSTSTILGIDWPLVNLHYSGIEIAPLLVNAKSFKHAWYYGWDIASGCIWGDDVIKGIKRIN